MEHFVVNALKYSNFNRRSVWSNDSVEYDSVATSRSHQPIKIHVKISLLIIMDSNMDFN